MQRKSTESKPYQTSKMECFCKYFSPSHSEKLPNNLRISNYVFPRIFKLNISMPTRTFVKKTLREKCPNTEFFWNVFSFIQSEYKKNNPEKTPYLNTFHAVKYNQNPSQP